MRRLLTHRDYDVYVRPQGKLLCAQIHRPFRNTIIAEIPAVPQDAGEGALIPLAKAAIERDLQARR